MSSGLLSQRSRPRLWLDGVERWDELTEGYLAPSDDAEDLTGAIPEQIWTLSGEAYQTLTTGTLWRYTSDHSGEIVPFIFAPGGNETPTEDAPHYTGTVIVGPRPILGGQATARAFIFDFAWRVVDEPLEVTA